MNHQALSTPSSLVSTAIAGLLRIVGVDNGKEPGNFQAVLGEAMSSSHDNIQTGEKGKRKDSLATATGNSEKSAKQDVPRKSGANDQDLVPQSILVRPDLTALLMKRNIGELPSELAVQTGAIPAELVEGGHDLSVPSAQQMQLLDPGVLQTAKSSGKNVQDPAIQQIVKLLTPVDEPSAEPAASRRMVPIGAATVKPTNVVSGESTVVTLADFFSELRSALIAELPKDNKAVISVARNVSAATISVKTTDASRVSPANSTFAINEQKTDTPDVAGGSAVAKNAASTATGVLDDSMEQKPLDARFITPTGALDPNRATQLHAVSLNDFLKGIETAPPFGQSSQTFDKTVPQASSSRMEMTTKLEPQDTSSSISDLLDKKQHAEEEHSGGNLSSLPVVIRETTATAAKNSRVLSGTPEIIHVGSTNSPLDVIAVHEDPQRDNSILQIKSIIDAIAAGKNNGAMDKSRSHEVQAEQVLSQKALTMDTSPRGDEKGLKTTGIGGHDLRRMEDVAERNGKSVTNAGHDSHPDPEPAREISSGPRTPMLSKEKVPDGKGIEGAAAQSTKAEIRSVSAVADDHVENAHPRASSGGETPQSGVQTVVRPNGPAETGDALHGTKMPSPAISAMPQPSDRIQESLQAHTSPILTPETSKDVLDQVLKEVTLHAAESSNEIRVVLKPESLGQVVLEVKMEENHVEAKIDVSQPAVKAVIEAHLPELRQALQDRGITLQHIEVMAMGQEQLADSGNNGRKGLGRQKGERRQESLDAVDQLPSERKMGYNTMEYIM